MKRSCLASDGTLLFECPGCGGFHGVTTQPLGDLPVWGFNGSEESPTLSPSVLVRRYARDGVTVREVCHSFVRDGRIEYLGDCTHALAGLTVDLPEWKS